MKTTRLSRTLFAALAAAAITFNLAVGAQAQNVLYNFPDGHQGGSPEGRLAADPAGNLYGVTFYGGVDTSVCDSFGGQCGTAYELSPSSSGTWTYHLLRSFSNNADGGRLIRGMVRDSAGNLYGTTSTGGNLTDCVGASYPGAGCGVVFKLSEDAAGMWKETVLYAFTGGTDGGVPSSNLTIDASGNLYGSTYYGGDLSSCGVGCGVVFRIRHTASGWHEAVLHSFDFSVDGQYPADVVQDASGNLYGTTFQGPNYVTCIEGCGVAWELSPTASGPWTESILYAFQGGNDGANPLGGMALDSAGNLYGTTELGGSSGDGTVYELSPTSSGPWTETQLHIFTDTPDGAFPIATPVFDASGNLYASTAFGGSSICSNGCGTVVELSPSGSGWTYLQISGFNGENGGDVNAIIFGPDGNLYGVAQDGTLGYGLVFQIPR